MPLNYNDVLTRLENDRATAETNAKDTALLLIHRLANAGCTQVNIYFDGSGDSGSVYAIDGVDDPVLQDELETWAYEVLEGTGVDWYNNEGGFGTIVIDVPAKTYKFDVNQRMEYSELAASGEVTV